ncbi:MAG: tetratricopeptide repeat protein, partial [Caldilineaceae bacterium]|nr:tetratricopeptide repeat protein [Caldilineaceae bacterium]
KLANNGELSKETQQSHAAFYADFLEQHDVDMGSSRQAAALLAMDPEAENFRVAWEWAIKNEYLDLLQRMLSGLDGYYRGRRRLHTGNAALQFAAEKVESMVATFSPSPTWLRLLADLYRLRAFYAWMVIAGSQSEHLLHANLDLLLQLETTGENVDRDRAYSLRALGLITSQRDRARSRRYYEQSLALYSSLNDTEGLVHVTAFLADLAWNIGDYNIARRLLERGLKIQQNLNDPEPRASLLNLLGIVALHQGHVDEAESHQSEALAVAQSIGYQGRHEMFHLGVTLVWSGRFDEGRELLLERIHRDDGDGMPGALAAAYVGLGEALLHQGDYAQSRTYVQKGLEIANVHKSPRLMGDTLRLLGQVAFVEGQDDEAHAALQESVAALRSIEQRGSLGWSLACLSYVAYGRGDRISAEQYLVEALQIAHDTGAFFPCLVAFPMYALFQLDDRKIKRAVEIYTLAAYFPFVANSKWFDDVAGHHVTAASTLASVRRVGHVDQDEYQRMLGETAACIIAELNG